MCPYNEISLTMIMLLMEQLASRDAIAQGGAHGGCADDNTNREPPLVKRGLDAPDLPTLAYQSSHPIIGKGLGEGKQTDNIPHFRSGFSPAWDDWTVVCFLVHIEAIWMRIFRSQRFWFMYGTLYICPASSYQQPRDHYEYCQAIRGSNQVIGTVGHKATQEASIDNQTTSCSDSRGVQLCGSGHQALNKEICLSRVAFITMERETIFSIPTGKTTRGSRKANEAALLLSSPLLLRLLASCSNFVLEKKEIASRASFLVHCSLYRAVSFPLFNLAAIKQPSGANNYKKKGEKDGGKPLPPPETPVKENRLWSSRPSWPSRSSLTGRSVYYGDREHFQPTLLAEV
ncbi:hypothetical protein C8Q69DRAFT_443886 [Paecilomyces variotii]|uniref:Uncharacterized protein n=1 Tax=Byssochlamys spectabilis TaxID=264951 RepID=A0A443HWE2_BYSSP|nr:hypothetical protein C8Q69DRAFT_443886 [Paecilomyces variotii]RWQ96148.1 hypothetical protein C8Q69DRAFT_443886 [Paecilomyces variotii]